MSDKRNQELLDELGIEVEVQTKPTLTPLQERIIAGFEDIQRFVEEHGRVPVMNPEGDIFERIYATRLEQIRSQKDCVELLAEYDHQSLLSGNHAETLAELNEMDDTDLLAELGIDVSNTPDDEDISNLRHVRSPEEIKAAEEIANRQKCEDFHLFKPIFEAVQSEIKLGQREIRPFKDDARVEQGHLFILSGQVVYVAEKGEEFIAHGRHTDSRLRVIYNNGTESNILMRSLVRALNKDEGGRRITDTDAGPLFTGEAGEGDEATGIIYVCRSLSDHPFIKEHQQVIHKIGVTSTSLERRFSNVEHDPTFLMADVEVVATYELFNLSRSKLENVLHRFFDDARLSIEIKDRFGNPVTPREWFCVPLDAIEEALTRIKNGSITSVKYDKATATIVSR
ncbi:MAG: GIY-YIG nuclease family protein [Candidatus Puniceispirillales bacterium]